MDRIGRASEGGSSDGERAGDAVGKRTLTQHLPVQRRAPAGAPADPRPAAAVVAPVAAIDGPAELDPFALHLPPVQLQGNGASAEQVHAAAARGLEATSGALPFAAEIQASFGPDHDVSMIQAHQGAAASEASAAMGASAYATGNHVVFGGAPDLHTAAHEAAHVVQQAHGVHLRGGVGQSGDAYEQHADAVADRVVAGQSAADLLAGWGGGATGSAVQRNDRTTTSITGATDTGNQYTQELMVDKTSKKVQVQLGVQWVKAGTWDSEDAYQKFIRWVKTSVYGYMDNKFKIVCTPDKGGDAITLSIDTLLWNDDSGYKITVHGGKPGGDSAMTQAGGNLYEYDSSDAKEEAITMAHEFGHAMLHASDEYANAAVPGRVLTNDHSIMANYYAQGKGAATFKVRHFQHLVAEVAKQYPGYKLKIEAM